MEVSFDGLVLAAGSVRKTACADASRPGKRVSRDTFRKARRASAATGACGSGLRSHSIIRLPTGLPLGPTLPARRSQMKRSQSRWDGVSGLRSLPKNLRNIAIAALSRRRVVSPLVGVTSSP